MTTKPKSCLIAFYTYDNPGRSVMALVNNSQQVINSYQYDSFGNIKAENETVLNSFKYVGEQYDEETGLIYLRSRYYDSEIGRFISKDPFPGYVSAPQTKNPYPYVWNNPVNFIDLNGLWPTEIHNKILEHAFRGILTPDEIEVLKRASKDVDRPSNQVFGPPYQHAMRAPGQNVKQAEILWNQYITNQLQRALNSPDRFTALKQLGQGMHALMDSTSPSHRGFQEWDPWDVPGVIGHTMSEWNISPPDLQKTIKLIRDYYQKYKKAREGCK